MDTRQDLARDMIEAGEEHFQIAIQAGRVMFWAANATGACELVSPNWEGIIGQPVEQALGSGWFETIAFEDRAIVSHALRQAIKTHTGFYLRYRLKYANSSPRWVLHDASPRFLPTGKFNGLLGTVSDCSDSHDGQVALDGSAQKVYEFTDGLPLGAVAINLEGRVVYCNGVLSALIGVDCGQLLGNAWIDQHVAAADRPRLYRLIGGETPLSELPAEIEYTLATRAGERLFRWHLTLIRDYRGQPLSLTMMGNDITQWRRLGDSARLSARVFESSNEAMLITDRDNNIVSANSSFTRLTGYAAEDVIGQNPRILRSGRHEASFYREMWHDLLTTGHWRGDIWDRRRDGTLYPKFLAITTVRDAQGEITHFSAIFHDVSERKAWEEKLERLAHFDELTDLPNRSLLQDRLEQAIAGAERRRQKFALLFIDLDGFKPINDSFGHAAGDEVLRMVATRLRNAIRSMDTAARLGGDEFVVILIDVQGVDAALQVAKKFGAAIAEPYRLAAGTIAISASIGVSLYPSNELGAEALLRTADEAMYFAKRDGKNRVYLHTEGA